MIYVYGPESSGNRLMQSIVEKLGVEAGGCSVPSLRVYHELQFPCIVMDRDTNFLIKSQIRNEHVATEWEAFIRITVARHHINEQLNGPYLRVQYEDLVNNFVDEIFRIRRWIEDVLEIQLPLNVELPEIYDGNEKYVGS